MKPNNLHFNETDFRKCFFESTPTTPPIHNYTAQAQIHTGEFSTTSINIHIFFLFLSFDVNESMSARKTIVETKSNNLNFQKP